MCDFCRMNVFITGASNGIGYQTALKLASGFNATVIASSRNKSKLLKLTEESLSGKGKIIPFPFDLATFDKRELISFLKSHSMSRLDVLINNAGMLINKPFMNLSDAEWKSVYEINVFAVGNVIRALVPMMEGESPSHILNISSNGAVQGTGKFKGLSAYSSSKAALINLTEALAVELKEKNIRINCLALGAVQTEMLEKAFPGYEAPVSAQDMAQFVAWFAMNGAKLFNGKTIPVTLGEI